MPGQIGNLVTAGHRVTYGKPYNRIDELRRGDAIVVETADGWAVYRYRRYVIVEPDDVSVTEAVPERPGVQPTEAWMTLIACHPPFSARQRYVGFAKLESLTPRARQVPAEVAAALRVPGEG